MRAHLALPLLLAGCLPEAALDTTWTPDASAARCEAGEPLTADFTAPPSGEWRINGDAAWLPTGVVMTDDPRQASTLWHRGAVDGAHWEAAVQFELGRGDHADGIAIAVQNDLDPLAVGLGGGSLGCNGLDALCIGLKTHRWERLRVFRGADGAPLADEVPVTLGAGDHELRARFDAPVLTVWLDGEPLLETAWAPGEHDLAQDVLIGVSAATGAAWDHQTVLGAEVGCR